MSSLKKIDRDRFRAVPENYPLGRLFLEISTPKNIFKNSLSPIVRASSRNETYRDKKKTSKIWFAQKRDQIISSHPR